MANVAFDVLYDQLLPYLPGAEPSIVDSQIRKTLREFMKRTTLVRELFAFTTTSGLDTYKLTPAFGQVSAIVEARLVDSQNPLRPISEDERRPTMPDRPRGWFSIVPDLISFYPVPDGAYPVTVNAVVTLKQTDTTFPEELADHYAEAIAAGVLASMMSMPGKPWTQMQSAALSSRIFSGMIGTIRAKLRDGGQPSQGTFSGLHKFGV